jgi:hypothetical protein
VLQSRARGLAAGDAVPTTVQGGRLAQLLPDVAHLTHVDPSSRVMPAATSRGDCRMPRPRVILLFTRVATDRAGHEAI